MKGSFFYRLSLQVLPLLFVWLTRIWFSTCRVRTHNKHYWEQTRTSPMVASFYHYTILFIFYYLRHESGVAMVSASRDGEYISRVANRLGVETVRGSRKKGGMQAIKSLIRSVREGKKAAIVADGSQGPAQVVQAGCIVLASHTGVPVLPMLWSCNRYKRFNSWDGTVLPMPFSRIDFFFGEPLIVPPRVNSEEVEKYRLILEDRLNDLYEKAWDLQGKTEH